MLWIARGCRRSYLWGSWGHEKQRNQGWLKVKRRKRRSSKKKKSGPMRKGKPIHDRRAMEKMMADLGRILETQEFESLEEANAFLNQFVSSGEPFPEAATETPLQKAQALMYEAWDAHGKKRIRLAKQALKISEDCADAYVLLAEEAARSAEEAHGFFEKGVQAGERAMGAEMFVEGEGHFWGILETRPYMRARAGLAHTSWALGKRSEAIAHCHEMLRLNPGDNQGIRYTLANWLLIEKQDPALADLLQDFEEDDVAAWAYAGALLTFRQEGASAKAERSLHQAITANPYVPDYLLGKQRLPGQLPEFVGLGDENEAIDYAASAMQVWGGTEGALAWLEDTTRQSDVITPVPVGAETTLFDMSDDLWYLSELDEDDFWEPADDSFPPFELARFLSEWEIPKKEHASIRRCLSVGLGKYYHDVFGSFKHGKQPDHLIEERMHQPYIFGYGAVEIIGHRRISQTSKLKTCRYLFETMQPDYENGVPYGLITVLGFMAAEGNLPLADFLLGTLALEFGNAGLFRRPIWMEGATKESVIALADWIANHEEMESEEKTWWAWKLSVKSDHQPHLGKAFAKRWLDREEISDESKLALCWAWVSNDKQFGTIPLGWRLMAAQQMGDLDQIKQLLQEAGIDPDEVPLPTPEELPPLIREEDDPLLWMMQNPQLYFVIPKYLKRLAVPAMVRLGEELVEVADRFWGTDSYDDALCNGVADAIQEFHHQLAPEMLRRLVERGIQHGKGTVRKTFYALSVLFYGQELLDQALQDNAKSVRTWAKKKLNRSR